MNTVRVPVSEYKDFNKIYKKFRSPCLFIVLINQFFYKEFLEVESITRPSMTIICNV